VRRLRVFLTAGALVILGAGPTRGDDDAGTGSVFAFGAGNRALALGGAYVSVADDASAAVWNPAGLGLLNRSELQATHTSLYGLDISEQYASLAVPSWRWGVGALDFRRFGVDGIEERSDRNVLLGDDLRDSQTEVKVSYGRAVNDAWSLGGSLKMRRHSLAGYDDFGIGLDLGLLVRPGVALGSDRSWVRRWALGAAIRNAIEPSLRLDQEGVGDPTAIQAGVSYRHPFKTSMLGEGYVLGAIDVAKAKRSGAKGHLGIEVVPHPVLALRAGANDGEFTTGAGIRWRSYSFDYVYENNQIDPLHRFGVSIGFGATVTETRQAALDRRENEFRERLDAAFADRQQARVTDLLDRGRSLLEAQKPDDALAIAGTVMTLDPENADARRLEIRALLLKAEQQEVREAFAEAGLLYARALNIDPDLAEAKVGVERCREESDRRFARTEQIRALFDAALDAFAAGELGMARAKLRSVIAIAPEDAEAITLLRRTDTAIRVRITELLGQAGRLLDGGLLTEAEEQLDRVRRLNPDAPGHAALSERLRKAERAAATLPVPDPALAVTEPKERPVVPKPPALSKKKREEITELYRRGMAAMEGNRPDDALRYWELVWLSDPGYESVAEYLKREYLLRGLEEFTRGRLEDAIGYWNRACDVDPTDAQALGYLARAQERQTREREILRENE
jgi:tetratricopeptide (TPR) repeat protein